MMLYWLSCSGLCLGVLFQKNKAPYIRILGQTSPFMVANLGLSWSAF